MKTLLPFPLLWLLAASANADDLDHQLPPAAEPKIHRDIAYTDPADDSRRLDVYAPADGKDHPVVIWLHGGGWRKGDKAHVQRKPQAFVDKGFMFVSVNYRFVPQVTVKEMTGDIAKAIRWVRDHAEDYSGAHDKIFVAGHSAGAHLSALVCTDGSYLEAEGIALCSIKGCIPVDTAVYDIPGQLGDVGPLRAALYTSAFGEDEAVQKQLSPITHVARDKGIPPFLILHVADRPDSTAQSRAFAKALVGVGVQARVVPGEGKTHATINRELGLPDDKPTMAMFKFLKGLLEKR
jgi:acetyl esterase/lipase